MPGGTVERGRHFGYVSLIENENFPGLSSQIAAQVEGRVSAVSARLNAELISAVKISPP